MQHSPTRPLAPRRVRSALGSAVLGVLLMVSPARPQSIPAGPDGGVSRKIDFVRDVAPLLREHCIACHGPTKQKGQLRLDSKGLALKGGSSGKAILPGNGKESRLIQALLETNPDDRMPQKADPLPPAKIDLLRRWIDQGALWPDAASGDAAARTQIHWSYAKLLRPDLPTLRSDTFVRNPVDRFIAAEHEARGLRPRPLAPKSLLLRRLFLDLIGLPPTREETAAFLSDESADAYEKVVDRLLDDPRYGERWARHWMDVWRYSDWAGVPDQVRYSQRHIWRWRDWIVESLNADKSYDRMILEMLAGDELAPDDPQVLRATGFLARNYYVFNRNSWMETVIEHTSKGFLGTTLNCARCHNHKYDPITQEEYYRFRAFFEPYAVRTDHVPGQSDLEKDGLARVFDGDPKTPTYLFKRGDDRNPDKTKELEPGVPAALGGLPLRIEPVSLPPSAIAPDKQEFVVRDLLAAEDARVEQARTKVSSSTERIQKAERAASAEGSSSEGRAKARDAGQAALEELPLAVLDLSVAEARRAALRAELSTERLEDSGRKNSEEWKTAASETQACQRQLALLDTRRNLFAAQREVGKAEHGTGKAKDDLPAAQKKLAEAEKAAAKAEKDGQLPAGTEYAKRKTASYPATSTGRRLALARWIASEENPLTARVAVNHLWARHFGKGLVSQMFEFGAKGQPPSHPKLLDWLATEFIRQGWSMKKMHRLLVTSSTYRMASTEDPAALAIDPENRYLWRMNPTRMEAEVVRDSVLYLSGSLDLKRGGPEIDHAQGFSIPRRSLYFQCAQERQMEFLTVFDGPSVLECYERPVSVVPQQALTLFNSTLVQDQSRLLARRLSTSVGDPSSPEGTERFVSVAFQTVLGRSPDGEELTECVRFLSEQARRLSRPEKLTPRSGEGAPKVAPADRPDLRARESLVLVLLNHNDFVTIR